jgi:HEAT repeat protein
MTDCADILRDKYETLRNDPRSPEELIPLALVEMQSEDPTELQDALFIMQLRASLDDFQAALDLCTSDNPNERALGVTILGQNLVHDKNFPEEKFAVLFGMLANEPDPEVLSAACYALGHIGDPRAIEPAARLKSHPSEEVRLGVVHAMFSHEDDLATRTLIELSADEDEDVRDWATFELGSILESDTPQIREALFARLNDTHDDTRFEARVGLARRSDERVLIPLMQELSSDDVSLEALDVARESENAALRAVLLQLKERWQGRQDSYIEVLERAIDYCTIT